MVGQHWHAVERDLIALGFRDQEPTLPQLLAICAAAPPGSAVRWSVDEGWDRASLMLANQQEMGAGLVGLARRYPRPGVPPTEPETTAYAEQMGTLPFDVMSIDQLSALRRRKQEERDG